MRKVIIGIAGTVVLLLAGILAWDAEATSLTRTIMVHPGPNYSLVSGQDLKGYCGRPPGSGCGPGAGGQFCCAPNCTRPAGSGCGPNPAGGGNCCAQSAQ
jgi:hypothetical protein